MQRAHPHPPPRRTRPARLLLLAAVTAGATCFPMPVQQTQPAPGQTRPATGQTRPATGQTRPATGQTRPATGQTRPAAGTADEPSARLAARLMETLGGADAWRAVRLLRLTFVVEREGKRLFSRTHYWDRPGRRLRTEMTDQEGVPKVMLVNLTDRTGAAYSEGAAMSEALAEKAVQFAHAAWINDTYWLLMPLKLRDPGVTLTYDGTEEINTVRYEKVKLTFDNVGLTPQDVYWAYLNPATGFMDRWAFVLKGEEKPPTTFIWKEWKAFGDLKLSLSKENPDTGTRIRFEDVSLYNTLPDTAFTSPEPVFSPAR